MEDFLRLLSAKQFLFDYGQLMLLNLVVGRKVIRSILSIKNNKIINVLGIRGGSNPPKIKYFHVKQLIVSNRINHFLIYLKQVIFNDNEI